MSQCSADVMTHCHQVMFGRLGGDADLLRPFPGVAYRLERDVAVDAPDEGELVLLGNGSATSGYLTYPGTPPYRPLTRATVQVGTATAAAGAAATAGPVVAAGTAAGSTLAEYYTGDRFRLEQTVAHGTWLRYLCRKDDLLVR